MPWTRGAAGSKLATSRLAIIHPERLRWSRRLGILHPEPPAGPGRPQQCLLLYIIFITVLNPYPTDRQWFLYCAILGLAGGGFTASLPGAIEWQVSPALKATGAIAVLALFLLLGINVQSYDAGIKRWSLVVPPKGLSPNPVNATVYIDLDDKLVKQFGSLHPTLRVNPNETVASTATIERDPGGLVVDLPRAGPNHRLVYIVEDDSQWWISPEVTIPPSFFI